MAAIDDFSSFVFAPPTPATSAVAVTPSDMAELAKVSRAIFVGGAGNLSVVMADGGTVTLTGVLAGSWLWLRVKQVRSTATTATNIVALT